MIEQELYQHLSGFNIYPAVLPENVQYPAMVYFVITDLEKQAIQGSKYANVTRFQIDIYAESYAEAKIKKDELIQALYNFKYPVTDISVIDAYEDKVKLFRQIIDFKVLS